VDEGREVVELAREHTQDLLVVEVAAEELPTGEDRDGVARTDRHTADELPSEDQLSRLPAELLV
jgi:hypothetical protein